MERRISGTRGARNTSSRLAKLLISGMFRLTCKVGFEPSLSGKSSRQTSWPKSFSSSQSSDSRRLARVG